MNNKKSRLRKIADEGGGNPAGGDFPMPIILKNPMEIVDNKDEIIQMTFGPSISREWLFEKPIDYAEWNLRSSNKITSFKKYS